MWARLCFAAAFFGAMISAAAGQITIPQPSTPSSQPAGDTWHPATLGAESGGNLPPTAISTVAIPGLPPPPDNRTGIDQQGSIQQTQAITPVRTISPAMPAYAAATTNFTPLAPDPLRRTVVRTTAGNGTLPNEQGQIWREYDITPYTSRVTTTKRPEQALVEWILQETGYEAWHSEPLGILSATSRTLRVYHTPQMQAVVADLVERFVASEAETRTFSIRVVTIDSPNWRAKARQVLKPVPVQTPGASAWLLPKENAAVLLADLQKRSDYREHSSPHLLVNNGQSTVISSLRAHSYTRDVLARPDIYMGYENVPGQIDEGFSLEFNPLVSTDHRMIDASIKCNIDQVEKVVPVMIEVPTTTSPRQRAKIDVPQIAHFRFHERFRWPIDQVLMIGMGMVAVPAPVEGTSLMSGLSLPLPSSGAPRADMLVIIETKGPVAEMPGAATATTGAIPNR